MLRRREGLAGGVGGFFQRPYVEVDARAPHATSARSRPATTAPPPRACPRPAIQALVEQAAPFADALARAQGPDRRARARGPRGRWRRAPRAARLRRPVRAAAEPGRHRRVRAGPRPVAPPVDRMIPPARERARRPPAPSRDPSPPALGADRPPSADAAEERLVAAGLSARAGRRHRGRGRRPRPAVRAAARAQEARSAPRSPAACR